MIIVTIIDDDQNDLQRIKECFKHEEIVLQEDIQCHTYVSYSNELVDCQADIIILDIDMPNMSGFEIAQELQKRMINVKIVFCSQHEDLVFNTFNINTFFFVRKSSLVNDVHRLLEKYCDNEVGKRKIYKTMASDGGLSNIFWEDIEYFEEDHNNVLIHLRNGTVISQRQTVKSLLEQSPDDFVQASYSFLVNMKSIIKCTKGSFVLASGKEINFSRRKQNRHKWLTWSIRGTPNDRIHFKAH